MCDLLFKSNTGLSIDGSIIFSLSREALSEFYLLLEELLFDLLLISNFGLSIDNPNFISFSWDFSELLDLF